uniref:Immunoglobulin superfamily member 10 n=1 Tax=Junco hyemalis TaxID=40217 RepID=A0A8C5IE03_JUNHY
MGTAPVERLCVVPCCQHVQSLPVLSVHPHQPAGLVRGVSGEPLALHCPAEGSPRPRVAWTLPGGRVLQRPQLRGRLLLLDNGTLLIGAASPLDTGTYLCRAHNDAGDSSLSVPVVVAAYTPRITGRPPPAIHTTPGAAIQLHCIVLGVPKPEITWELPDGSVLSTAHQARGSGGALLHPTGTLLLQNPQPSGSGTYRCTARNPLARNTAGVVGTQAAASLGSALQWLPSKAHLSRDRATTERISQTGRETGQGHRSAGCAPQLGPGAV